MPPAMIATSAHAAEWQCELDAKENGVEEKWFDRKFEKPIHLPGTLDEVGHGEPRDERMLRCLSRTFEHIGSAWYQREITVPPDWAGTWSRAPRVTRLRITTP